MIIANTRTAARRHTIRHSRDDKVFYSVINTLVALLGLVVLLPLLHIVAASFSDVSAVYAGKVFIWPVAFTLEGYEMVFINPNVLTGYLNTIYYTVVGTIINVSMTMIAAYPLARKNVPFNGLIMFLFTFTMLFGGGMIPNYITLQAYGLINTRWALLIPGAISTYNLILCRTFLRNIPQEILSAAQIDGCSDIQFFLKMALPLSKAVIAVITLYYGVAHWNAYFGAFLYLSDRKMFPLQIILREVLIQSAIVDSDMDAGLMRATRQMFEVVKYALIIVATAPILCLYPFVQKYFIRGVMIGSIKG